jgi:hypothetical protein
MKTFFLALLATPLVLAQVPAPQPANLWIEGVVTDQLTGSPVAGAHIDINGGTLVEGDAAGRFRFDGLRPGGYRLRAVGPGYLVASQDVVLSLGQTSAAVRIALAPQSVTSGTVTDALSGAPVAGARIVLDDHDFATISDAAGHFQFERMEAGRHSLAIHRTGYLPASKEVVLTTGQHSGGVRISLMPQTAIAGSVEDRDGFPVERANIAVSVRGSGGELEWRGGAETDDRGKFRVAGLTAGVYYLHVESDLARFWDARYTDCFYPEAVNFEDAQPIEAASGQERGGILVRLPRVEGVRVQGRVALPPGLSVEGDRGPGMVMLTAIGTGGPVPKGMSPLAADGSFSLDGVAPGKYRLEPELPPPYNRGIAMAVGPNLEVGAADVTGILLHVEKTTLLNLRGEFVFEPGTERDGAMIVLKNHAHVVRSPYNSEIDLDGVPPGKYHLEAITEKGHALAVSARLGGAALPNGDLELRGPDTGRLVITFSSALAQVEGVVVDAAGQPVSGKYALFRSIKPALQPVVLGIAKPGGHFSAVLPPGEYRVWTAADVPANLWDGAADAPPGQGRLITFVKGNNPPLRLAMPPAK